MNESQENSLPTMQTNQLVTKKRVKSKWAKLQKKVNLLESLCIMRIVKLPFSPGTAAEGLGQLYFVDDTIN